MQAYISSRSLHIINIYITGAVQISLSHQRVNSTSLGDAIPHHWLTINKTGQTNIHYRQFLHSKCLMDISIMDILKRTEHNKVRKECSTHCFQDLYSSKRESNR